MSRDVYRFSGFEVDSRRREIRHAGHAVPVQPRVFDLVLYLLEHRDRAVGKDELQDALWPGVIVTETALTRAVMKARRTLGDDPERQAVIRTVHGHGYRFVAALESDAAATERRESGPAASTTLAMVLGGVLMAALVAVAALLLWRDAAPPDTRIAVLPVSDRTGDPELAWVPLGLMGYANQLMSEAGALQTVPARRVMGISEGLPDEPSEPELQDARTQLGASHLLHSQLHPGPAGYQLTWQMAHAGGTSPPRELAGADPARLAQQMVRDALGTLPGSGARRPFRTVSEDDFVNEAYARGLALQLQGEVTQARDFFEVAVRQAPALFWPRYELALTLRDMGELDRAQAEFEELTEHPAARDDPEARVAALNALAQVYWRRGDHGQAEAAYGRALSVAESTGDARFLATIHTNLGILTRILGEPDAARRHLSAALRYHRELPDAHPGHVYQSLGQLELQAGRPSLARDHYLQALQAFRDAGDRRGEAAAINAAARADHRLARYRDARDGMHQALEMRVALGDHFGQLSSLLSLAELEADAERWNAAHDTGERALDLARSAGQQQDAVDALEVLARIALGAGRPNDARDALDQADRLDPEGVQRPQREVLRAGQWALDGNAVAAREVLDRYADATSTGVRIDALILRGSLSSAPGAADDDWRQALDLARSVDDRAREVRVRLAELRRAERDGDRAKADELARLLRTDFADWPAVPNGPEGP
ncbi:MAG: tetratricopeptide repeat protein [Xanthomonadales bacterium]|nr:tetratricopeptide repeat protein [Xanthomonadales bacterium]